MSAVFSELNKGEAVTAGLRKVTDDMKSKNRADRSGVVSASAAPKPAAGAGPKAGAAPAKPPKLALEGKKWAVENQVGNSAIVLENVEPKQTIYVYNCTDCVIQVKGKANNITLDKCKKTGIVFESLVSACEVVNCTSMKVQCTGSAPTVAIDKVDGCQLFLGPAAYGAAVTTAKSSEVNIVCTPADNTDDPVETAVPEQFISTRNPDGKWTTVPIDHSGG